LTPTVLGTLKAWTKKWMLSLNNFVPIDPTRWPASVTDIPLGYNTNKHFQVKFCLLLYTLLISRPLLVGVFRI